MLPTTSLTRRDIIAGIAAGAMALLASPLTFAQVSLRGAPRNPAHILRDRLALAPVTSYEGVLLEPVPWVGTSFSPYMSSVGGVHVLITDRMAAPFGSYVVYLDAPATQAGVFLGEHAWSTTPSGRARSSSAITRATSSPTRTTGLTPSPWCRLATSW